MNRTHGRLLGAALILGLIAMSGPLGISGAADPPEPSASAPRWELRFDVQQPLRLVKVDDQWYWIMTYLVQNRTDEDQIFVPNAILSTDYGHIIKDGEASYKTTKKIIELIGSPFLKSKNEIIGTLKQGKEYAEEGLLVWKASDDLDEVRDVRVFVGGLSSDTQVVQNPVTSEDEVVRKHLAFEFDCPGDPRAYPDKAVTLRKVHWIMR